MIDSIKTFFKKLAQSRLLTLCVCFIVMSGILIYRLFELQIVKGEDYLNNFSLSVEKEREIKATRGNIYDRNGELLAYNELAYSVVIEDNGTYASSKERSEELNKIIAETIMIIEAKGDSADNNFGIQYNDGKFEYTVSGTAKLRFLADVFGRKTVDELQLNKKLGFDESKATAEQVMQYLMRTSYSISDEYPDELAYQVAIVRYGLSSNYYRKFITTTIATDVSYETVAAINENGYNLSGVSIEESTLRKYVDSECFCHIIGYTGRISQSEYDELSKTDKDYSLNDSVGIGGIEKYMESELKGKKGSESFYVDNLGKITDIIDFKESVPGNNVYLSIDKNLQVTVYNLLEQEIAGIVYNSISNIKHYNSGQNSTSSDVVIPIYDVYFALIDNGVIDIDKFYLESASKVEKDMADAFSKKYDTVMDQIKDEFTKHPTEFKNVDDRMSDNITYIINMLKREKILVSSEIDKNDPIYLKWADGDLSVKEYLEHCIAMKWIDVTKLKSKDSDEYSDSDEIYKALVKKITGMLKGELEFHKLIYKYLVFDDEISGRQICLCLFEQDILADNESDVEGLKNGSINSYNFLKDKIKNLEITPAQLALDPCAGSSVIINPQTGELLACVSYPGFDNNRMANGVDAAYYSKLLADNATPLFDFSTQQETAPGSTFKPFISVASLTEGILDPYEKVYDEGVFTKIENQPKCWLYRSNRSSHGDINVSEALRDSCNYFFYEMGYRMATTAQGTYSDEKGIGIIRKYAELFGLSEKTGIEIPESDPNVATEYPVMAAIGQSNNSYTTIGLARYIATIANSGTVYNLTLLDKVTKPDGTVVKEYHPEVKSTLDEVDASTWTAVHYGMRLVCENSSFFKDMPVQVAGKTGTAQLIKTRPSHALFAGYAPYSKPTMAIVTRIPYGYTSSNAAEVSSNIIKYFFDLGDVVDGQATTISGEHALD